MATGKGRLRQPRERSIVHGSKLPKARAGSQWGVERTRRRRSGVIVQQAVAAVTKHARMLHAFAVGIRCGKGYPALPVRRASV